MSNLTHPTPLTILTGFLGAGKTTVLNRLLNGDHQQRIAVLVNDFGAINIDAQLVVDVDETANMVNLSNGCICCTIRGDLVQAVLDALAQTPRPDHIVIETSGVSDPIDVVLTLRAVNAIQIESVITVIDAENVLDTGAAQPVLAMNQIGTADLLLLNKVDLVSEPQLEAVRSYIREVAPQSRIIETRHGDAPLPILLGHGTFDSARLQARDPEVVHVHTADDSHHDHDHAQVFVTWSWHSDQLLSWRALKRWVNGLPESVYRAKGIFFLVDAPDERVVFHLVGKRITLDRLPDVDDRSDRESQFVLIGMQGDVDADALKAGLDACLAINAPQNEVNRLATMALSWLRGRHHNEG